MIERVRAILVTPDGNLLAIKRSRPGTAPYCVLPGGHVEPDDAEVAENSLTVETKSARHDLVTSADRAAEQAIIEVI